MALRSGVPRLIQVQINQLTTRLPQGYVIYNLDKKQYEEYQPHTGQFTLHEAEDEDGNAVTGGGFESADMDTDGNLTFSMTTGPDVIVEVLDTTSVVEALEATDDWDSITC